MSQGRDGLLYSTISNDGTKNVGTVFNITPAGQLNTIYSFCPLTGCADGASPLGGVTLGFDGNFYGTTQGGGSHGAGTVFKVTPTGTLTTLWNFANGTDDSVPFFTTLQGQDGNMYGVSAAQYNGQYGAFFKVSASGVFKALRDFGYTNGANPNLPTQGTDGNFYGTAQGGGDPTCRCGVVYKATAAGAITVLHNFKGYPTDGYRPLAVLVQGYDGNFYGTTYQGGTKNFGSVYKITPAGSESVLYSFCSVSCNDGFAPATPLVLHTDGKFYGNTNGNSLGGSVFYSFDVGFKPLVDLVTWSAKVGKTVEILGQGFTGPTDVS